MKDTLIGMIAGVCFLGTPVIIFLLVRVIELLVENVNIGKTVIIQLSKIDQITTTTLSVTNSSADTLRTVHTGMFANDSFEDLRRSFENGIKNFEEESENPGDDEDPWKKKK